MVDEVNTYEATPENPDGHVDEMVAKAEGLDSPTPSDRPEWLPEKFSNPEDMAQAYLELEQRLGGQSQEQQNDNMAEVQEMEAQQEEQKNDIEAFLADRGLDFDKFAEEFESSGSLSDPAYTALEQAGISRNLVDNYLQGQQAMQGQLASNVYSMVGGEKQYEQMLDWASDNLSDGEIEAFNANIDTNQSNNMQFAVNSLYTRYMQDQGSEPSLLQGSTANTGGERFGSLHQLTESMADPRYEKDPAYRAQVARTLERSSIM